MPKIKDSKGNFHKDYRSAYRAEKAYRLELRGVTAEDGNIDEIDEPTDGIVKAQRPKQDAEFTLTEKERREAEAADNADATEYHCNNCHEVIEKGVSICPSCGAVLDWRGID